ncbi:hypothetical protein BBP40_006302 [Aspergillus hancockii]|nr:hypothetical protein BBP40_006302 [Aspergillus hancockii]
MGNEKASIANKAKETLQNQAEVKTKPQNNNRDFETQASSNSKVNNASKLFSQGNSTGPVVGHPQPPQPPRDGADALTTFPPFANDSKSKVKKFLESQALVEQNDTSHQSIVNFSKLRPPTPWPGAAEDPELGQSVDYARPQALANQPPRLSTTQVTPRKDLSSKPDELGLKDLRLSNLADKYSSPLPPIATSQLGFLPGNITASFDNDPDLLTPIAEVPSEISRPSSPVDFPPKTASCKSRPIVEQPIPVINKPPAAPVEKPIPKHSAPSDLPVTKSQAPAPSTVLPSHPPRPGTPQLTIGLPKPKEQMRAGTAHPQVESSRTSSKGLEQKTSNLNTTSNSGQRRPEMISEKSPREPSSYDRQKLAPSPFFQSNEDGQTWDLETIASEDSWFQENEDSDGSTSGESGPRRTPPGQVRARLTVETVECTIRPPALTPNTDDGIGTGQARNEFFPPWAVGSQALSEGARTLKK